MLSAAQLSRELCADYKAPLRARPGESRHATIEAYLDLAREVMARNMGTDAQLLIAVLEPEDTYSLVTHMASEWTLREVVTACPPDIPLHEYLALAGEDSHIVQFSVDGDVLVLIAAAQKRFRDPERDLLAAVGATAALELRHSREPGWHG